MSVESQVCDVVGRHRSMLYVTPPVESGCRVVIANWDESGEIIDVWGEDRESAFQSAADKLVARGLWVEA